MLRLCPVGACRVTFPLLCAFGAHSVLPLEHNSCVGDASGCICVYDSMCKLGAMDVCGTLERRDGQVGYLGRK